MKFGVITDIHYGPEAPGTKGSKFGGIQRKLVKEADDLVSEFVGFINEVDGLDFVINLGDSIEDLNETEPDIRNFKKIQSSWKRYASKYKNSQYYSRIKYIYGTSLMKNSQKKKGEKLLKEIIQDKTTPRYIKRMAQSELSFLEGMKTI